MLQLSRDELLESYRRMKTIREFKPQLEKLFADGVDGVLRKTAESIFGGGKQRADLRAKLASIKVPIQVIFGAKDQIISAEHAKGLPSNVTVHIIPTAGHMSHMEAAGEVNRLIAGVVTA